MYSINTRQAVYVRFIFIHLNQLLYQAMISLINQNRFVVLSFLFLYIFEILFRLFLLLLHEILYYYLQVFFFYLIIFDYPVLQPNHSFSLFFVPKLVILQSPRIEILVNSIFEVQFLINNFSLF